MKQRTRCWIDRLLVTVRESPACSIHWEWKQGWLLHWCLNKIYKCSSLDEMIIFLPGRRTVLRRQFMKSPTLVRTPLKLSLAMRQWTHCWVEGLFAPTDGDSSAYGVHALGYSEEWLPPNRGLNSQQELSVQQVSRDHSRQQRRDLLSGGISSCSSVTAYAPTFPSPILCELQHSSKRTRS